MRFVILVGLGACLTAFSNTSKALYAQNYDTSGDAETVMISEAAFDELLDRVEALEATVDGNAEVPGQNGKEEEDWEMSWGGRVMVDYVTWADQDPSYGGAKTGKNYLEIRRARFRAEGEGFDQYFWQIELDFAADDDSSAQYDAGDPGLINVGPVVEMKDVYMGVSDVPLLGDVLIGHFKAPFSIEELTSSRHITFMERALPNAFVPSRGSLGRVKPFENFLIGQGTRFGRGAWELKVRWSYIDVNNLYGAGLVGDTSEDAERVNNLAAGVNWYWNPYTRVTFDYWHSWSKLQNASANEADLLGLRMQYDF